MSYLRCLFVICAISLPGQVLAGTACVEHKTDARAFAEAAASASRVYAALEQSAAPVALVARAGTDLSKFGLHYSHVAFVVRDHPDGRWTAIHLLNRCSTSQSRIYAQGLVNFFLDDLVSQDARIVWLKPEMAARVSTLLSSPALSALHNPHYNLIARYDSSRTQNSTAWVLDVLAAAELSGTAPINRARAQSKETADGFRPDTIRIEYGQRILGGLFSANTDFTDHPISTRLSGNYPVVTVRAIFRYLEQLGMEMQSREWRDGVEQIQPGPA